MSKRKIIDAHAHLYDHTQNRHEFLEAEDKMFRALVGDYSSLPRTYSFANYLADAAALEVDGLVWNEFLSTDPIKEVLWAQRLAESLPIPVALVGRIDCLSPDLEKTLDIYSGCPNVSAVREHLGWDETNQSRRFARRPDLMVDSRWLQGLCRSTASNVRSNSSRRNSALCSMSSSPIPAFTLQLPSWGGDSTSTHPDSHAGSGIWPLSACPNVTIIISAVECVFGMNWSIPQAQPWIDTIFELFGPGRTMFGSHRPICKLSSTFPEPYRAHEVLTAKLTASEQDAVFRQNAASWFFAAISPKS